MEDVVDFTALTALSIIEIFCFGSEGDDEEEVGVGVPEDAVGFMMLEDEVGGLRTLIPAISVVCGV